jgi:hypothetical protein
MFGHSGMSIQHYALVVFGSACALEPGGRRRGERATPVARRATGARDAGRRTRDVDDATTRRG